MFEDFFKAYDRLLQVKCLYSLHCDKEPCHRVNGSCFCKNGKKGAFGCNKSKCLSQKFRL